MKKIKLTLGLIVIIFVALVIYQNRTYFLAKQALSLNLGVETWHWTAPEVQNVAYFGGCLVIGFLMAGYLGIASKFKSMKTIKHLNKTLVSQINTIESLQTELETFKQDPYIQNNDKSSTPMLAETADAISSDGNLEKEHTVKLNKA
ncbi:MAG: hypothetical protein HQK62_08230 [Desulfamplus sp.]|nr:hypothetical protein [Desulfamplus sp.]